MFRGAACLALISLLAACEEPPSACAADPVDFVEASPEVQCSWPSTGRGIDVYECLAAALDAGQSVRLTFQSSFDNCAPCDPSTQIGTSSGRVGDPEQYPFAWASWEDGRSVVVGCEDLIVTLPCDNAGCIECVGETALCPKP